MLLNQRTKTLAIKTLLSCLTASLVFARSTWGADKSKDEETLKNSATALKAMLDSDTFAAGPAGATSSSSIGDTDLLTYGRAQGAFAGMSLGGATLSADNDANQRLYDKAVTPKEIVREGAVQTTTAGQDLVSLLNGVPANRSASNRTP